MTINTDSISTNILQVGTSTIPLSPSPLIVNGTTRTTDAAYFLDGLPGSSIHLNRNYDNDETYISFKSYKQYDNVYDTQMKSIGGTAEGDGGGSLEFTGGGYHFKSNTTGYGWVNFQSNVSGKYPNIPYNDSNAGCSIGWNFGTGFGCMTFLNNYSPLLNGGRAGFVFYQRTGASTARQLLYMTYYASSTAVNSTALTYPSSQELYISPSGGIASKGLSLGTNGNINVYGNSTFYKTMTLEDNVIYSQNVNVERGNTVSEKLYSGELPINSTDMTVILTWPTDRAGTYNLCKIDAYANGALWDEITQMGQGDPADWVQVDRKSSSPSQLEWYWNVDTLGVKAPESTTLFYTVQFKYFRL